MTSHPISVRNKSSKFTLTKKEFHEGINKIANNAIAIKDMNKIINYQSEFSQYKKSTLKKNTKNNQTQNSNHINNKGNNTIDKSKKILNTLNSDFLKLFREMDLLKKNKYSNKTAIDSLQEKNKLKKSIHNQSIINSKSKEKNLSIQNKNNNFKKPKKQNSKSKNLKINSIYEPIHTNEKNNTFNNTQRNVILTSNNKKKSINLNNNNIQKKKFPKKNFKTFNPFHIKFSKPINGLLKNKIKQSNITTYNINFSKLIPNKINSLQNHFNKTQDIIHNTSKTKKKQDFKKSVKKNNNSNNNILNDKKFLNNKDNKLNNTMINKKIDNNKKEYSNKNLNKLSKDEINNFEIEKNLSDIDIFDEKENLKNNDDDDDEESENSGVLAYDEVRDIIIYYDMGEIEKKNGYLFNKDDYKNFLYLKKDFYLNFFFNKNNNFNRNIKLENKKQKVKSNDNKIKNNFINEIKN